MMQLSSLSATPVYSLLPPSPPSQSQTAEWAQLPRIILDLILAHLKPREACRSSLVCRDWLLFFQSSVNRSHRTSFLTGHFFAILRTKPRVISPSSTDFDPNKRPRCAVSADCIVSESAQKIYYYDGKSGQKINVSLLHNMDMGDKQKTIFSVITGSWVVILRENELYGNFLLFNRRECESDSLTHQPPKEESFLLDRFTRRLSFAYDRDLEHLVYSGGALASVFFRDLGQAEPHTECIECARVVEQLAVSEGTIYAIFQIGEDSLTEGDSFDGLYCVDRAKGREWEELATNLKRKATHLLVAGRQIVVISKSFYGNSCLTLFSRSSLGLVKMVNQTKMKSTVSAIQIVGDRIVMRATGRFEKREHNSILGDAVVEVASLFTGALLNRISLRHSDKDIRFLSSPSPPVFFAIGPLGIVVFDRTLEVWNLVKPGGSRVCTICNKLRTWSHCEIVGRSITDIHATLAPPTLTVQCASRAVIVWGDHLKQFGHRKRECIPSYRFTKEKEVDENEVDLFAKIMSCFKV